MSHKHKNSADLIRNDAYASRLFLEDVEPAIENAFTQRDVQEGGYGGGIGMTCHIFPRGTGTSSSVFGRVRWEDVGGDGKDEVRFTAGVLVQTNSGHLRDFLVGGVPIGRLLLGEERKKLEREKRQSGKGGRLTRGVF